eukprot:gene42670-56718_t
MGSCGRLSWPGASLVPAIRQRAKTGGVRKAPVAWKLHLHGPPSPLPMPPSTASLAPPDAASAPVLGPDADAQAPQQVVKVRRDYNSWVATETMEDYALRYTPQRFRKWSEWRVANTAFGAASFLILEAVGAT